MSMVKDAIKAMREVLVLSDKVDKSGALLSEIASELREHDRRLIRLETMRPWWKWPRLISWLINHKSNIYNGLTLYNWQR